MQSEELIELLAAALRRPHPPGPKYVRLFEAFARAIAGGRLEPGERLPGEIELARHLPVSLGTVQRTMRALSDHRLVIRSHGRGTFVSSERATGRDVWVYRFRDEKTGGFLPVLISLLSIDLVSEPGPWTAFFGEQTLVRVERLLRAGEEPYTYSRVYLSAASCRPLVRMQFDQLESMSIHRLLDLRFGIATARFDHRISAGRLSEGAREKLDGATGALGLSWDVWGWTEDGSPASFQRIDLPLNHRPIEITGSPAPAPLLASFEIYEMPMPTGNRSLGERARKNIENMRRRTPMSDMNPTRRDALRLLAATAALGACPAMPWRPALAQGSQVLRWGSSSLGSTGYVIIEALVQTANKHSELRSSSLATGGGAENMALIGRGELEFGQSTSSDWAPATKGEKPFPEPVEAHQMFAYTIWNIPLIVHADSGIGSFADLAGKRVMPSQPGSAAAVMYQTILRAAGLEDDIQWNFGSWSESYDAFKAGAVDAVPAVLTNGRQSPQVEEVLTAVDVTVLATPAEVLDKAQALNPGILRKEVAPEAWAALAEPMEMPTISGVVAAHPSVSPDVGYALTKAIFDNAAEVRKVGVQLQDIDINFAVDNLLPGYPVNAGAARYFQEKGIWRDDLVIAS